MRLLDAVLAEAERCGRPDLQARLAHERGRLATPTCPVAVVGEFKQGKGTLVNALLGTRACGTDPVAATLLPTLVRYAPQPTAALHGVTDAQAAAASGPVTITAVHAATQAPAAGDDAPAAHGAEVGLPRRLLATGLTLLDTPGLSGGLADGRAAATLRAAADADAVVFVTDASQELTAPELDLIRRLAGLGPTVLLALTKVDVYPAWRRILATDLAHLRRAGLAPVAFPLAAPLRHHALGADRADLDAESGYPALATHLRDEIAGGRQARLAAAVTEVARDTVRQLLGELETERAVLADPAAARALKAELDEAERRAKELTEAAAGWRRTLADRGQEMAARLRDDLDDRLRAVESAAAARIEAGEPARDWDEMRGWLYRQTNDALLTHRLMIRSEAQALVTAVTREFDADWEQVRAAVEPTPARRPAALDDSRDPEFRRIGGFDLITHGARGGGVGMMIVSMAGTAAGLVGFAAAPVLAPVGLGVLLVLGRRTIASIRENELRTHRANALRAAREYLAETRRVAVQDSAGSREQVLRNVRDALTTQAAELAVSARRNQEASARAIKATWDGRRGRLAAVDAEIARLRALAGATT
ncbi:dynamin family protein [Frankia sp. QA3]|uniref:dynamin family protein n=1 Tax=Frankia sp. QA3 TaxID=710111 RepID=UPI0002D588F3|nr:dynamin family protein [Frankia sp. QA3]